MTAVVAPGVEAALVRYSTLTRQAIERYLPDDPSDQYLYGPVRNYLDRGGKGIRAALLLATCEAFGRRVEDALAPAASLEMLHNAFLIHDDIEDDSPLRRHRQTMHRTIGVPLALNAGDALAAAALQPVRRDPALGARVREILVNELSEMIRVTTEGQALELGWRQERLTDLAPMDYIALAGKKTCWYTTVTPLRMGAVVGSYGTASLGALSRFGFFLGLAFQTRDDLLDIEVRPNPDKAPLSDIREAKHTLMMIHLLATAGQRDRAMLSAFMAESQSERTADKCARVLEMMHINGSVEYARIFGAEMAASARMSFSEAFSGAPSSEHLSVLRGLTEYVLTRTQ